MLYLGFMQMLNGRELKLSSYSAKAGKVLASGSNACAAAVMGMYWGKLSDRVQVHFAHGSLQIAWQGPGKPVYMTGSAALVFDGQINL